MWIGLFVGLFLLLFQPFGLQTWDTPYKSLKIAGFGLVSFVITALVHWLPAMLYPVYFREENWTVGREIIWVMLNVLLIAFANYLYLNLYVSSSYIPFGLPGMLLSTFLLAIFPVTGIIIGNYILQLKKYSGQAGNVPLHPMPEPGAAEQPLIFIAENEKDSLTIAPSSLFFIESSDNYSTFYHLLDGQTSKTLLRSSLSRLESQLTQTDTILRCHRSFIVNLDKVEKMTGNAQGYKLHLNGGQFIIPVARKYNDTLIARLK